MQGLQENGRAQSAAPRLGGFAGTPPAALPDGAAEAASGGVAGALQHPPQPGVDDGALASSIGNLDVRGARSMFADATLPHSTPRDAPWEAQLRSDSPTPPDQAESAVPGGGGVLSSAAAGFGSPQLDSFQQASTVSGDGGVTAAQGGGFGSPVIDPGAERGGDAAAPMPDLDGNSLGARQPPAGAAAHRALGDAASSGSSTQQQQHAHAAAEPSRSPGGAHAPGGSASSSSLQRHEEADAGTPRHPLAIAAGEQPAPGAQSGSTMQQHEEAGASALAPLVSPQGVPGQVRFDLSGEEAAQQERGALPPSPGSTVPPAADGDAVWSSADHRWDASSPSLSPASGNLQFCSNCIVPSLAGPFDIHGQKVHSMIIRST